MSPVAVAQLGLGLPAQSPSQLPQAGSSCLNIPPAGSADEVVGEPPADLDFATKAVCKREERSRFCP